MVIVDGRQSEMALSISRGTRRLLRNLRFSTLTELPLASGRRADVVALASDGTILIVEIKSSRADFRTDTKWPDYRDYCDRFYFAVSDNLAPDFMPADAGLIVADSFGAAMLRDAPEHKLSSARRRAMLMRFAHAAAHRLHGLTDPEIMSFGPL